MTNKSSHQNKADGLTTLLRDARDKYPVLTVIDNFLENVQTQPFYKLGKCSPDIFVEHKLYLIALDELKRCIGGKLNEDGSSIVVAEFSGFLLKGTVISEAAISRDASITCMFVIDYHTRRLYGF